MHHFFVCLHRIQEIPDARHDVSLCADEITHALVVPAPALRRPLIELCDALNQPLAVGCLLPEVGDEITESHDSQNTK